jgi:hypothetical protein
MTIQALSLSTVFAWYLEHIEDYRTTPVLSLSTALTFYLEHIEDCQISYFPSEPADGSYQTHVLTVAPFSETAIPYMPALRDNDVKSGDDDNVLLPQLSGRTLCNDEIYNLVYNDIPFLPTGHTHNGIDQVFNNPYWDVDVEEELETSTD